MGWDPTVYNPWAIFGLVMPHDGIIVDEGYFHDCCDHTTTYYMQNGGAEHAYISLCEAVMSLSFGVLSAAKDRNLATEE